MIAISFISIESERKFLDKHPMAKFSTEIGGLYLPQNLDRATTNEMPLKTSEKVKILDSTQLNLSEIKHILFASGDLTFDDVLDAIEISNKTEINDNVILNSSINGSPRLIKLKRRKVFRYFYSTDNDYSVLVSLSNSQVIGRVERRGILNTSQRLAFFSRRRLNFYVEALPTQISHNYINGANSLVHKIKKFRSFFKSQYLPILNQIQRESYLLNVYGRSFLDLKDGKILSIIRFAVVFAFGSNNFPKWTFIYSCILNRVEKVLNKDQISSIVKFLEHENGTTFGVDASSAFSSILSLKKSIDPKEGLRRETKSVKDISLALERYWILSDGPTVAVFCLDDFKSSVGGVQLYLGIEAERVKEIGGNYLAFYPTQFSKDLQDEVLLSIKLNDDYIGDISSRDLNHIFDFLQNIASHRSGEFVIALHSLLGHSLGDIIKLLKICKNPKKLFFLHDYYSVCPSVKLMRNDWEYCAAPPVNSTSCKLCVYGSRREVHIRSFSELFELKDLIIVSPSKIAQEIFIHSFPAIDNVEIYPHSELIGAERTHRNSSSVILSEKEVRVAFIGYPMRSKGWFHFVELAKSNLNSRVKFYSFSVSKPREGYIIHVPTSQTGAFPNATTEALIENEIDAVMIWALWPETYSYVTLEALAAGCKIITNPESGNVSSLARESKMVIEYEDFSLLLESFKNNEFLSFFALKKDTKANQVHKSFILDRLMARGIDNSE